ncbi:hypothetical protein [Streptomyces zaomyceticus]|uniref:Uncharacterized protein n=1 Tax=Streptomyces zaomyceticus TaxID=68286 RepID=A0ABZ1LMX4_9ACTN|nr:hypothetical protein OG237_42245 [Streptomyces zaomyceticus]
MVAVVFASAALLPVVDRGAGAGWAADAGFSAVALAGPGAFGAGGAGTGFSALLRDAASVRPTGDFAGPFPPPLLAAGAVAGLGARFSDCFICRAAAASAAARAFFTSRRLMFAPPFFFHRSAPARSHARITLGGFLPVFVPPALEEFWESSEVVSGVSWKASLDIPAAAVAGTSVAAPLPVPARDAAGRAGSTGVSSELSRPPAAGPLLPAGLSPGPGTAAGAVSTAIAILALSLTDH